MKIWRKLEILIRYLPLLLMVLTIIQALYISATMISDKIEQSIQIWTNGLRLAIAIGMIENFILQDIRGYLNIGQKVHNIVEDFIKNDSDVNSVMFNDLCVIMFFETVSMLMHIIYMHNKMRLFFYCSIALTIFCLLGVIVNMLAMYFQTNLENQQKNISGLSNPGIVTVIIELFLVMITSKTTVGIVLGVMYEMEDAIQSIVILIVVLCYAFALVFCHFSNLYFLISFVFINPDVNKIQGKIENVLKKNKIREDNLRRITRCIDEKAEKVNFLKKCKLGRCYLCCQIRSYFQSRKYEMEILLLIVKLKIIKLFSGLLEEDCFKINSIRFCEIMIVLELLILDMFLFIRLGSSSICSRFFELLSTVVIIPILLSSLTTLKSSKH